MKRKLPAAALRLQDDARRRRATDLAPPPEAKAEEAVTASLVAHVEEAIARTRQLLHDTEHLCQERRAARKRQAEPRAAPLRKCPS
jgi:hypothetical protein